MKESVRVEVVFSPELLEEIDRQAAWLGLTRATYIRQAAARCAATDAQINSKPRAPSPDLRERIKRYFERREGVRQASLRQLQRAITRKHEAVSAGAMRAALDALAREGYGTVLIEDRMGGRRTLFTRND